MPSVLTILAAIFGAVVGSFLNVLILRDNRRKSILAGRSACPHCKRELRWFELIPIVSFALQGGTCRRCHKSLSWQYPIVEVGGVLAALYSLWFGYVDHNSIAVSIGLFIALSLFIVLTGTDLRTMEVRVEYAVLAAFFGALPMLLAGILTVADVFYGIVLGAGSLGLIAYAWQVLRHERGMGEGDLWIAGAIGAIVGYPLIIVALFAAVLIGSVAGILWAISNQKSIAMAIPFGPFLALGMLVALTWGPLIIRWYIL